MKTSKSKKNSQPAGFYRGIVTDINTESISGINKKLKPTGLNLEWIGITDTIEISSISVPVRLSEQGILIPKVKVYANAVFEKLLSRGFRPQQGMELKDQNVDAFLIRNKGTQGGRAYMISLGPPVVVAALNHLLVRDAEIHYKKFDLRALCDFLFKNPNFSNLIVRRLNFDVGGRENPTSVSRCSVGGPDVFKSNFFSDLIGVTDKDRRDDYNPFTSEPGRKRARWTIEPTSCRINLQNSFWMNLDRYGNFLFHLKTEKDMILLVESLQIINEVSHFLHCAIPLKKEDEKLEEKSGND